MKQVEGVFKAVCEVKGAQSFDGKVELTTDERRQVVEIVSKGLHEGEIDLSERAREKYDSEDKIRKDYAPGLVNNHLRKDKRLNGGVDYKSKNPGSRAGSGDKMVKELKKLKSTLSDPDEIAMVEDEINKRIEHLKAERNKTVEIDTSLIPDELKSLVNSES